MKFLTFFLYIKNVQPDYYNVCFLACMDWSQRFQYFSAGLADDIWSPHLHCHSQQYSFL